MIIKLGTGSNTFTEKVVSTEIISLIFPTKVTESNAQIDTFSNA